MGDKIATISSLARRKTDLNMLAADRLFSWRDRSGLGLAKAADILGVRKRSLAEWERGLVRVPAWVLVAIEQVAA